MMKRLLVFIIFLIPLIGLSQTYDRANLKERFETGDVPTQQDFEALINSMYNLEEDTFQLSDTVNYVATKYDLTQIGGGGNSWPLSGNFSLGGGTATLSNGQTLSLIGGLNSIFQIGGGPNSTNTFGSASAVNSFILGQAVSVQGGNVSLTGTDNATIQTFGGDVRLSSFGGKTIFEDNTLETPIAAFNNYTADTDSSFLTKRHGDANYWQTRNNFDLDNGISVGVKNFLRFELSPSAVPFSGIVMADSGSVSPFGNVGFFQGGLFVIGGNGVRIDNTTAELQLESTNRIQVLKPINLNDNVLELGGNRLELVPSTSTSVAIYSQANQGIEILDDEGVGLTTPENQFFLAGEGLGYFTFDTQTNDSLEVQFSSSGGEEVRLYARDDFSFRNNTGSDYANVRFARPTLPDHGVNLGFIDDMPSASLTDGSPTSAQLNGVFTSPVTGHTYKVKDSDGTGLVYIAIYDGINWYTFAGSLAP